MLTCEIHSERLIVDRDDKSVFVVSNIGYMPLCTMIVLRVSYNPLAIFFLVAPGWYETQITFHGRLFEMISGLSVHCTLSHVKVCQYIVHFPMLRSVSTLFNFRC